MIKYKNRLRVSACAAALCVFALGGVAGCSQPAEEETEDPYRAELYLPAMTEEADGTLVQLTPDEVYTDALWYYQGGEDNFIPYNTYFAKSDDRGCASCHDDLKETLEKSPYDHAALKGLDVEWTVQTCLGCHYYEPAYLTKENTFATMIHGIHTEAAECWNCHDSDTTLDASGKMHIWEDVKHQKLRGITAIASDDVGDSFTYSQEETLGQDELFNMNATHFEWEFKRDQNEDEGAPLDPQLMEDWTITISGLVNEEKTFDLSELIDEAPSKTLPIKLHCMYNPTGGPGIGQVMAKGIPLSYLTDQCGIKDEAVGFTVETWDGLVSGQLIDATKGEAYFVYEIDGEPLSWANGYPVMMFLGNVSAAANLKQVSNIVYRTEDDPTLYVGAPGLGIPDENGEVTYLNKPNVGIIGLQEGQVVKTGETLTIKGYADAFDLKTTAVEVSMDCGATWKRFDIEECDTTKWVTWSFDFTPTEDSAYCFAVRSVAEDGTVSRIPIEKMIVAKSNLSGQE